MSARRVLAAGVLAVAAGIGVGRLPLAVIPAQVALVALPAKHRPHRGASRDRALPGKARRRARRAP